MPIDGLVFTALCRELSRELVNARVQGVQQAGPHELLVQLRLPGRSRALLISAHPQASRLHLTGVEPPRSPSPSPFCLFLRRHLIPGRLLGVEQPPFERVARLVIEGQGDDGERALRELVVEATGRHSNVILVDRESGLVLDALKRIPAEANRLREIFPGKPYLPPPSQEKLDPGQADFEAFDRALRHSPADAPLSRILCERWMGIGPFASKELLARAGLPPGARREELDEGAVQRLWESFRELFAALARGEIAPSAVVRESERALWIFPILSEQGSRLDFPSVSALLDWDWEISSNAARKAALESRLRSALRQHLERLERKIARQEAEVESGRRAEELKAAADLLTANLYRLRDLPAGTEKVRLAGFSGEGEVEIELDPALTPAQNAQEYYRRFQKAKKTVEKASQQLQASIAEREYLESVLTSLALCTDQSALEEVEQELLAGGYLREEKGKGPAPKGREPAAPMAWSSSDGFPIFAGRNNRQNEHLTLRVAHDHDLWFHAKDIPGAHVLVRTGGRPVPERTLYEAAQIAALHSKARSSANVPVDYTQRRHVRKPKGSRPGMVIYERQKTLYVTPDPAVLDALKPLA